MPLRRPTWMLALLALQAAGCALHGDVDMLESELRRQESIQQDLSEQLKTTSEELRVARADADDLRARWASRAQVPLTSEQAEVLYKAQGIKFNMLLTSGIDQDGQPGDEGVSVLILPVDSNGDLVKLVGAVELELLDLARDGSDKHIGTWQFTVDQVREHWHRGFLSAGYLFKLDWQSLPSSPELTLHAKLTAPDGRKFDSTTQLKVTPPGSPTSAIAKAGHAQTTRSAGLVKHASASTAQPDSPKPKVKAPRPAPSRTKAAPPVPPPLNPPDRAGHSALRPADVPLRTSDSFTEGTIPFVR